MDAERIAELQEAVAKVKGLDKAVELGWWDDWSVTLAEGVEVLLAENERLREVLHFYADPTSYENETPRTVRLVITDQGQRAREALNG